MLVVNKRYQVVKSLGRGSHASVLEVVDLDRQDSRYALKLLLNDHTTDLLQWEFSQHRLLAHRNLAGVHDLGTVTQIEGRGDVVVPESALFMTQDLVRGLPADRAAATVRHDVVELGKWVTGVAAGVCRALAYLHARRIVHRDLKPTNVIVGEEPKEARLVDLAFSTRAGKREPAAGSVGYMAPEALTGAAEPRSDLFALGATMYELLSGRLPFGEDDDIGGTVRAILAGDLVPLEQVVPGVTPALSALVTALVAPDPRSRPGSAEEVLLELGRLYGPDTIGLLDGPTGVVDSSVLDLPAPTALMNLDGPLIGREQEIDILTKHLAERLEPAQRGLSPLVALVGPAGVGKSAIAKEATQRLQLIATAAGTPAPVRLVGSIHDIAQALQNRAAQDLLGGTPRLAAWLGQARVGDEVPDSTALCEELTALAGVAAEIQPLLLHLEGELEGLTADLLLYLHRQSEVDGLTAPTGTAASLAWIVEARKEKEEETAFPSGLTTVAVSPLDNETVKAILADRFGRVLPVIFTDAACASAMGRPLLLAAFLSKALSVAPPEELDQRALAELTDLCGTAAALAAALDSMPDDLRQALVTLAIYRRHASPRELAELLGGSRDEVTALIGRLWHSGWVELDEEGRARARSADLEPYAGAQDDAWVITIHRRAVELLAKEAPEERGLRAHHAVAAGLGHEAGELSLEAGRYLLAAGDVREACRHLEAAVKHAPPRLTSQAKVLWRKALLRSGQYDEAVQMLRPLAMRGEATARVELARALRLAGDSAGARVEAERSLADPGVEKRARAILARLELDDGAARQALAATALNAPAGGSGEDSAALEEAAGLARLALGDLDLARAHFEKCLELARTVAPESKRALLARASSLLGMEAHHREDWEVAERHFRRAEELARASGHVHAGATYGVNLAIVRLERGLLGEALAPFQRAISTLAGVGRTAELAGALYNYASLLLALGDLESCERVLDRSEMAAHDAGARQVEAYCQLLRGDLLRRQGAPEKASERYQAAITEFEELENLREEALGRLLLAEVHAERGHTTPAVTQLGRVTEITNKVSSEELGIRLTLARARVALAGGLDVERPLRELHEKEEALRHQGRLELRWRAELLHARLESARGEHQSAQRILEGVGEIVRGLSANVPEAYRERWASDPDRMELRRLRTALAAMPLSSQSHDRSRVEPNADALRRLLNINKRLNSELRLGRLLDEIIDTIVELTRAERGFLLLKGRKSGVRPRSARNMDRRSLETEELRLSRSIAEQVIETGEPVLTIDAQSDSRFGTAASVHALRLRSILAVPLRVKGEVVGAVYVDDRVKPGAFGDGALELVQDVADQAAIAIENARLLSENRRRQREIESLNRQLQKEVDRQRIELEGLRRELDDQRRELATKYSYDAIVARSAAMEKVFRVLDRVIDSEVSVVIQGESGTGKELVARAIHFNGARQERPFVTENCGAIPETLLESVLFGHVKGAFTGADRSRPGLFEIASGGTLLLDEVSEMSPAMQSKLLRVLQEGEVRPVGGERLMRVDVRVIASSNRDLGELVKKGEFRQDLYYRLNVITVVLPPLRERLEDIPLLVEHFLGKHGNERVEAVDRSALRMLTAFQWPGNVRQLENEVMRAAVLADDVISEEHLSPELVDGAAAGNLPKGSDLDLRAHVERLERNLITQALDRFGGNQSRASEALGLSRYGLQKKMTRYDMRKPKR